MPNETSAESVVSESGAGASAWLRVVRRLDLLTWLALLCIVTGWFFLDAIVVSAGPWRRVVHFYELAAIIASPVQLLFGIDRGQVPAVIGFGVLCLGALCLPMAPFLSRVREAWLAYLVPLALMLICGALLYARTRGDLFNTAADAGTLTSHVARFANDLFHRASQPVARRISIGAGTYLALIGCLFLTQQGLRRYRAPPRVS